MFSIENRNTKCWLCETELTDRNSSKEHIIPNGIGGRLKSQYLLCEKCNTRMGNSSDATLCEDLKFYTEMFQVDRERNKELKGIVMTDSDGDEIIVKQAGQKLTLRKQLAELTDNEDGSQTLHIQVRDEKELKKTLDSYVRKGKLSQKHAQEITNSAKVKCKSSPLTIHLTIRAESFLCIMKSLANFYVYKTNEISAVNNLKQFLLEGKDCKDRIALTTLEPLRLAPDYKSVYHTLLIKGTSEAGLVGIAEFFSTYSYGVILNNHYEGSEINECYCFDVINGSEVNHHPDVDISVDKLKTIKDQYHMLPTLQQNEIKFRADAVMKLWDNAQINIELHSVIEKVLSREVGEGGIITKGAINKLTEAIINEIILRRLNIKFPKS